MRKKCSKEFQNVQKPLMDDMNQSPTRTIKFPKEEENKTQVINN